MQGRVAVVTGGGSGIGAAAAEELGRRGAHVVVVDPGVGVDGEDLAEPTAAATAERIRAAGGRAESSTVSVTDTTGLDALFQQISERHGALDVVVNTAGIVRYGSVLDSTRDDWASVFGVHYQGYVNVLRAALARMSRTGRGRVVGFTSGVGLARSAGDALVYGAAKRAVATLTWQLGPLLPPGVGVNALSPIAATRMVRTALVAGGANPQGLDLSNMPQARDMAPAATYLAGSRLERYRGQVLFSAGSELTLMARPRLLEAVRTAGTANVAHLLATVMPEVLAPAEAAQRTTGGTNPRFGDVYSAGSRAAARPGGGLRVLVASDRPDHGEAIAAALAAHGVTAVSGDRPRDGDFDAVERRLAAVGPVDAVIVASQVPVARPGDGWSELLDHQAGAAGHFLAHAAWLRAAVRAAAESGRPLRLVHLSACLSGHGWAAAQAVTQMARSLNDSRLPVPVAAFSLSLESDRDADLGAAAQLAARLVAADDGLALRGSRAGRRGRWLGLRSHPAPGSTVSFGGPDIPEWVDGVLLSAAGAP